MIMRENMCWHRTCAHACTQPHRLVRCRYTYKHTYIYIPLYAYKYIYEYLYIYIYIAGGGGDDEEHPGQARVGGPLPLGPAQEARQVTSRRRGRRGQAGSARIACSMRTQHTRPQEARQVIQAGPERARRGGLLGMLESSGGTDWEVPDPPGLGSSTRLSEGRRAEEGGAVRGATPAAIPSLIECTVPLWPCGPGWPGKGQPCPGPVSDPGRHGLR